jgi:hypothetical protein
VELARVYVSSTIADLTEERRAVLDWLRLARHQAVDSYLPDSDTVRDSCLEDVAGCDLYVLILGHRYGFQPPDGNPEGLSITQLEFRRAGECGIPRVALLRTSIPDVSLSDLADPQRMALVSAFRDEVADQVRTAQFSDLQGLIQGLSTGIQNELGKLDKKDEESAGQMAAGRALRLAPRPVFLAGREKLLAELEARLAGGDGAGPRVVALCGLGGAGKTSVAVEYAHRHLGEVGVAWQLPAEDPAVLAARFGELAAQLGAADRGDPVAAVHGLLAGSPVPWLLVFDCSPRPLRGAAARLRAGPQRRTPGHPSRPAQSSRLDRTRGRPDCGPRSVRGAAARLRAGHRCRAPKHPDRPTQPRPLDRGGRGCGRSPRPARRAPAYARTGHRPRAPGHPDHPRRPRLLDGAGGAWP